ncbi:rRNA maturation RNase YbeY [Enemella sp. A6]|uniref:rRNA maturation RNase YbeY n=1 Tax=Enemella sp. A6 TaxID=3440152 RepID=UPI003EBE12C1
MTVELTNESGAEISEKHLVALAEFVLTELRVHPQAVLSLLLVDEAAMTSYHEQWMGESGPTDVLSFPMDELRPGYDPDDETDDLEVVLGDVVLCPQVTDRQAAENGRRPEQEMEYLMVHGILHLLGFDHDTEAQHAEMFGLKDRLLAAWDKHRP